MNAQRLDVPKQKTARYAVKAVLFALAAAFFALLPAVIEGGGALLLRSDFNYQQIVFQMLTGDFYKSGNFGWSPVTDLGSGIISSYSGLISGKELVGKGIDNILFHVYDLLIAKVIDIIIYQYNAKGAETARREGYFLSNQLQSFIILSNYRKKVFLQRR